MCKKVKNFFLNIGVLSKNISKKNKIITAITLVIVLIALTAGIVAGVLLFQNPTPPRPPVTYVVSSFTYAIKEGDKEGVSLRRDWMQGRDVSSFTVSVSDSSLKVDSNMVLTSAGSIDNYNQTQTVKYFYKDKLVTTYNIVVVAEGIYIKTLDDLRNLPEESRGKVYIQKNDITITSPLSIDKFNGGVYYGNYFALEGLDMSSKGGLFNETRDSLFYNINLTGVEGNIIGKEGSSYGALINTAIDSSIFDSSVSGAFFINAEKGSHIGGLVGYIQGKERRRDTSQTISPPVYKIFLTTVAMDITIQAKGNFYLGGVAGKAVDMNISEVSHIGDINVQSEGGEEIYIGGVAGHLAVPFGYVGLPKINAFDNGARLTNKGNITINIEDKSTISTLTAGGILGRLINHSLSLPTVEGNINITTTGSSIKAGGVVGYAENTLNQTALDMLINKASVTGEITLEAMGNLFGGGVIGHAKNVSLLDTLKFGTLVVDTGSSQGREIEYNDTVGKTG